MLKPDSITNKAAKGDPLARRFCVHSGGKHEQEAQIIKYAEPELKDLFLRELDRKRMAWGSAEVYPTFWLEV